MFQHGVDISILILGGGLIPHRPLVVELGGKIFSNSIWSGELRKMLDMVAELNANRNFKTVTLGQPLIALPDKILKDLLTDQTYGYRIATAIRTGVLPENLINLEIGPVSHPNGSLQPTVSENCGSSFHFLTEKNFKNLRLIIEFTVGASYPCWFQIILTLARTVKHSWLDGPRHVLFQLKQLKYQKEEVIIIVKKTVKRSAWFAFSESII